MFYPLVIAIVYSLLTFGAVLRHSWLVLTIFWLGSAAAFVVFQASRNKRLSFSIILLAAVTAILFEFLQPKLAVGVVGGVWSWAAVSQAGNSRDAKTLRFFHILLFIGIGEALLGFVQFFISPGWIFGYVSSVSRSSGTLINRNHYAGLLELLMPIAWGLAYIAARRYREVARSYTYLFVGAFMPLALLLSLSRMGIFSFFVTILLLAILLRLRSSNKQLVTGLGLGFVLLIIGGGLWIGLDAIVARYAELVGEEALLRDGRMIVYRDTIRMITAHPGGIGTGNYQDLFRRYQTFHPDVLFDHAHNDYLETLAEWGAPTAALFWIVVIFILVSAIRAFLEPGSPERQGILLTCIGALFSILVHSLTDFNLQIPSNAMLFFAFLGIATAYSFSDFSVHGASRSQL